VRVLGVLESNSDATTVNIIIEIKITRIVSRNIIGESKAMCLIGIGRNASSTADDVDV
jgi:hypothetical protein